MSRFKSGDLVYRVTERGKYGVGVIKDDFAIGDPNKLVYEVVTWQFPLGSGWCLDRAELISNLLPVSCDDLSRDEKIWLNDYYKRTQSARVVRQERKRVLDTLVNEMKHKYLHKVGTEFDNAIMEMEKIAEKLK